MAKKDGKENRLKGTLSAFMTIIEKYPKLLVGNYFSGRDNSLTVLSFSLDILSILGVSDEFLYDWLAKLLVMEDENGVEKGILTVLESSIRTIILTYLNGLYTCQIDPILPDEFLNSPYNGGYINPNPRLNNGFTIPLSEIDAFGLLDNCPVAKDGVGPVFYFDVKDFNAGTVYRSTDFNAYLWYVINRGASSIAGEDAVHRNIWDNRWFYSAMFKNPETGELARRVFVDTKMKDMPVRIIDPVGVKKEILYCEFVETALSTDTTLNKANSTNALRVWGMADRYYRKGLGYSTTAGDPASKPLNKTIFQFNADYMSSIKLFDSKTIVAQVINSILGFSNILNGRFSFEVNLVNKRIEQMVEEVITAEVEGDPDTHDPDYYFKFSDEKYSDVLNDAELRYSGRYYNEQTGEFVQADYDYVVQRLNEIDEAQTPEEMENAIKEAMLGIKRTMDYGEDKWEFEWSSNLKRDLIFRLIKETMVQIALQLLTPKLMLIFAINARFLGETTQDTTSLKRWEAFFKDFWNVFNSCIKKIVQLFLQEILDLIISQIRPIVELILKKLLLETIVYYRMALELLLRNCVFPFHFNSNRSNFVIDHVRGADIIPKQTTPEE